MTNQSLLQQAERLLINYYKTERTHYANEEIKRNIRDWYENTEITNAYDLATISMVGYNKNIPYKEIESYIKNNRSKITNNNMISSTSHITKKEDLKTALLWWSILLNASIQAFIHCNIFVMGYVIFGSIISQSFNLNPILVISGSFLLIAGHAAFLIFLRNKYKQLTEREKNK